MKEAKLEQFREILNGQLANLLGQADATVIDMTDARESFPDPSDRASMESERSFTLRIRERERKLISKIKEALECIDEGTFGICEDCGDDIDAKRIAARPVTTLCIECKTKQETDEKSRGA